ncbi:accessory gland protein Acp76A-like [Drosophila serrata]|uniref:accessory gland protein Acp76A-like n=1 Tax=Drosophila serrata TaxID=7274 RepID=UPI000A1D251D|nr:accessory gland protein Acp76A-like [Drosophila serrata]
MKPSFFNTKMMYGTGPFASFMQDEVRGVTIPLSKSDINLIIFMPIENKNNVNNEILGNLNKYLDIKMEKNQKAHLYIPVLVVDNTLDLGKTLESFGIKKVFTGKTAGKLFKSASIFKQLNVLKVKPLEYQWEAEYPEDDDNKVILIDKPFVFVIKDSKTIYMAGRVDTLKGATKL